MSRIKVLPKQEVLLSYSKYIQVGLSQLNFNLQKRSGIEKYMLHYLT